VHSGRAREGPRGRRTHAQNVQDVACVRRVDGDDNAEQTAHNSYGTTGSNILKKILAAAAVACLAGLTGCSVSTPAPDNTTASSAPAVSAPATTQASPSRSSTASAAPQAGGAKEACELFNSLYVQYRAAGTDPEAMEDVYRAARDVKDDYSGNLKALFTTLGALAIDHSSVADTGGQPAQASKDAVRDAVFANAGACTAEGVTLTL